VRNKRYVLPWLDVDKCSHRIFVRRLERRGAKYDRTRACVQSQLPQGGRVLNRPYALPYALVARVGEDHWPSNSTPEVRRMLSREVIPSGIAGQASSN
jgi:hypothetical protein